MTTADQILKIAEELRGDREWIETSKGTFETGIDQEKIVLRYHSLGEGEVQVTAAENGRLYNESYYGPNPWQWWAGQRA